MKAEELGVQFAEPAPLELTAKMYNINSGHNTEKLKQSRLVAEYSAFTAKVRELQEETAQGRRIRDLSKGEQQQTMAKAVDWCIANNILKDFLTRHREEVIMMIYQEWDMDTALEVEHEEGRNEGIQTGHARDALNALAEGLPIPTISRITGLDTQTITQLAASVKQNG
jgi:predicted transposase/invertase (TIGR01784 family)